MNWALFLYEYLPDILIGAAIIIVAAYIIREEIRCRLRENPRRPGDEEIVQRLRAAGLSDAEIRAVLLDPLRTYDLVMCKLRERAAEKLALYAEQHYELPPEPKLRLKLKRPRLSRLRLPKLELRREEQVEKEQHGRPKRRRKRPMRVRVRREILSIE